MDDIIHGNGGTGNDFMEGGWGDDLYVWGRGYGNDRIGNRMRNNGGYGDDTDGGEDRLLVKGYAANELSWQASDKNLLVTHAKTEEMLTLENWYVSKLARLDKVMFEDGTFLTSDQIDALAEGSSLMGTAPSGSSAEALPPYTAAPQGIEGATAQLSRTFVAI